MELVVYSWGKPKKKKKDGRGVGTSRRSWCDGVEGNRVVGVKFIFAGLEQPHCIHLFFFFFFCLPTLFVLARSRMRELVGSVWLFVKRVMAGAVVGVTISDRFE